MQNVVAFTLNLFTFMYIMSVMKKLASLAFTVGETNIFGFVRADWTHSTKSTTESIEQNVKHLAGSIQSYIYYLTLPVSIQLYKMVELDLAKLAASFAWDDCPAAWKRKS